MSILTQIGDVICDVTISTSCPGESEVTPYPVEVGTDPIDSVRDLPRRFTAEVLFTNTPLTRDQAIRAAGVMGLVSDGVPETIGGYAETQYKRLTDYRVKGTVVRIVSRDHVLERALLTSVTPSRDSSTGNAMRLSISAIEYNPVANRFTTIQIARPSSAIARKKQRDGKHVASEFWGEDEEAGRSEKAVAVAGAAQKEADARRRFRDDEARAVLNRKRAIAAQRGGI